MKKIEVYQIYFNEQSKANCFPEWKHYDNSGKLTEYFENSVIVDLINKGAHKNSEYFAVFSHDIKKEIIFKESISTDLKYKFGPQELETVITKFYPDTDWFAFEKRRKQKNIVTQAERYHPGFIAAMEIILKETGFMEKIPVALPKIVLFNHFIAKSDLYEQYVKELLIPAMEVMKGMPELFDDARYIRRGNVPHGKTMPDNWTEHFKRAFGVPHYPYHPFICERLPSVFLSKYSKIKFRHIF